MVPFGRCGPGSREGSPIRWLAGGLLAIGILGVVVWASFDRFVHIAPKIPEAVVNLAAIRTLEFMFFEKHGAYVSAEPTPAEIPGADRAPWPLTAGMAHGFNTLGFLPEGAVRCQYGVSADGAAFTIEALCPHGGGVAVWGYVQPAPGQPRGILGPFGRCSTRGVLIGRGPGSHVLETVGPCDEQSATLRD